MGSGFNITIIVFILIFISIFVGGSLNIVVAFAPVALIGFYLYTIWRHQQRVRTQKWDKSVYDMGFSESGSAHMLGGTYRDHEVRIDEIDVMASGEGNTSLKTRYLVAFENPKIILLYMKKRLALPLNRKSSVSEKYLRDIHVNNPLLEGLVIKGNNENDVKSILDADICSRIVKFKGTLYELEIGYGIRVLGTRNEIKTEPNAIRYLDSQQLVETKGNALRFKLILDTLIDIAEKIETYTPHY